MLAWVGVGRWWCTFLGILAEPKFFSVDPYLSFMKVRELLLKIDIEAEIELLNEIHYTIAKSVWKLKTGQWPEMAKFVDNFFRNTYGAREFWVRLGTSTDKIMICHSL